MKVPELHLDGRPIRLGKRIGKGGEGEVYLLDDGSNRALKFYTATDQYDRESKVTAMVDRGIATKSNFVAFPLAIARRTDGKFAGFLMNLVTGHKPLFDLQSPQARKKNFPGADYRFLIRAATNIARAVGEVHREGCVIGDINHSGILISDTATAALIDADSFQFFDGVRPYICRVGVPEFTPPELQAQKLSSTIRSVNHDAFGLAVVVFQLLFMGRHPFSGTPDSGEMPIHKAIGENRFVYSRMRRVGMTPPPAVPTLADFPLSIAEAFERAFGLDGPSGNRPTADQWISLLEDLERSLSRCSSNSLHYYPSNASACPWCRIDDYFGMALFVPSIMSVSNSRSDIDVSAFDFEAICEIIYSTKLPKLSQLIPVLPTFTSKPSLAVIELKKKRHQSLCLAVIEVICGVALLCFWPGFWVVWLAIFLHAYMTVNKPQEVPESLANAKYSFNERWAQAAADWLKRCSITELQSLQSSLDDTADDYRRLPEKLEQRIERYYDQRRTLQLTKFLEQFAIRDTKIRGIATARLATLTSYGIETAADLTETRVNAVPGIGSDVQYNLYFWRMGLEKKFKYDSSPNKSDEQHVKCIEAEIESEASELRRQLLAGTTQLTTAVEKLTSFTKTQDPLLTKLCRERSLIEADCKYLGIGLLEWNPFTALRAVSTSLSHPLSVNDVYSYFGSKYAHRGSAYARDGKILTGQFDKRTKLVTGTAQGRRKDPYRIKVQLDGSLKIQSAKCTCPMGGLCKHSAGLLLALIANGKLTY